MNANQKLLIKKADLDNYRYVRYWGSEFEHPEAGNCAYHLANMGAEIYHVSSDSTVPETSDNNCGCDKCQHSCNCSNCQDKYGRCSNAYKNEVAISPREDRNPVAVRIFIEALSDPELIGNYECYDCDTKSQFSWCENCGEDDLSEAEGNSIGFHTHIDARGLTLRQVGSVMRLGAHAFETWGTVFGAHQDGYNRTITEGDIENVIKGGYVARDTQINAKPIIEYLDRTHEADQTPAQSRPRPAEKATIEFRAFRATNNADLHLARVAFARAVVDYVAEGKPLFYLLRETSFEKFLEALEIGKH